MRAIASSHFSRVFVSGVAACASIWIGAVLLLWAGESWLVFRTDLSRAYTAPFDRSAFRVEALPGAEGGQLEGAILVHRDDRDRYWVLFCPPAGASTHAVSMQSQMRTLWRLGYNVLAFDYRGFGDTPGTPTEEGLYADGRSAYRHLVASRRVGSDRIVLAGRSLGAAVAVQLATRVEAAGLLLLAPIDSVPDVGSRLFPWAPVRLLATHRFDTHASAMQIDLPVIVVHGHPDRMMRLSDTRRLLQSFRGPKLLLQTGGGHHHAGFVDVSSLYRALRHFWPVAPPPTGL